MVPSGPAEDPNSLDAPQNPGLSSQRRQSYFSHFFPLAAPRERNVGTQSSKSFYKLSHSGVWTHIRQIRQGQVQVMYLDQLKSANLTWWCPPPIIRGECWQVCLYSTFRLVGRTRTCINHTWVKRRSANLTWCPPPITRGGWLTNYFYPQLRGGCSAK